MAGQKKPNRRLQTAPKKKPQKEKAEDQLCYPWTLEEETASCKGWVRTSEDSDKGNARNERRFWVDILKYIQETFGAGDANYLQRALTDYHVEYKVLFTLLHCWEVLKECDKLNSEEVHREGSINLNTTVGDEEDEMEEVWPPRPMGRDQANRKSKAGAASSASAFDVESLAKMMANEHKLELKAAELEIRCMENRQRDEALYETTTDEVLKAILRHRLFG
ncbi:hypothetical protein Tco_0907248 [Tanacetum coccineum]|uniref:No apical meristem-associated C-terminal domain-containing protein n=1 Tax=Tanacetum coccineum TaxID=301880 RepID=A0ABQ5CKZ7_9ASTR